MLNNETKQAFVEKLLTVTAYVRCSVAILGALAYLYRRFTIDMILRVFWACLIRIYDTSDRGVYEYFVHVRATYAVKANTAGTNSWNCAIGN